MNSKQPPESKRRSDNRRVDKDVSRKRTVAEVFAHIDEIRKRIKPLPKGVTIKDLIEEGRL